jgi:hypothetical protein
MSVQFPKDPPDKSSLPSAPNGEPGSFRNKREALEALQKTSMRLRLLGAYTSTLAFASLVSVVFAAVSKFLPLLEVARLAFVLTGISICFVGLACLYVWERRRNEGMIYYEEISDELEWRHRGVRHGHTSIVQAKRPKKRPHILVRIQLRRFLTSTDLPLAPGRYAVTAYTAFYVICIVLNIIILFTYGRDLTWFI